MLRPSPTKYRMIWIRWESVFADGVIVAAALDESLPRRMTVSTQTLSRTSPEFHRIVVVRDDVISDCRRGDLGRLLGEAQPAERLDLKLMLRDPAPSTAVMQDTHSDGRR
jgi:hypothetical protein